MTFSLIADLIVFVHALIAVFMAAPLCCIICKAELPVWFYTTSFSCAAITFWCFFTMDACPLTSIEVYLRSLAGERIYQGSFINHYKRGARAGT